DAGDRESLRPRGRDAGSLPGFPGGATRRAERRAVPADPPGDRRAPAERGLDRGAPGLGDRRGAQAARRGAQENELCKGNGMLKLWGRINSINVQKVLWALEELKVPYERVDAGLQYG